MEPPPVQLLHFYEHMARLLSATLCSDLSRGRQWVCSDEGLSVQSILSLPTLLFLFRKLQCWWPWRCDVPRQVRKKVDHW